MGRHEHHSCSLWRVEGTHGMHTCVHACMRLDACAGAWYMASRYMAPSHVDVSHALAVPRQVEEVA